MKLEDNKNDYDEHECESSGDTSYDDGADVHNIP